MIRKALFTLREMRKTAYHHYGSGILGIFKFCYYSGIRINTFVVYGIDLNGELLPHNLDDDFEVLMPTVEELELYRMGKELTREFFYDKIHGIEKCYLVLFKGEIAYIHWVYQKGDPNRFLILGENVAELNYNTTLLKFRGRGLMAKMIKYIFHDLRKEGFKKAVGVINKDNIPAIKSAEKAGWSEIGHIKTLGFFNRKHRV